MFKGAKNLTSKQNKIIRYSSILIPIIMLLYSAFIKTHIIEPVHPVEDQYIYVFGLWWIAVILVQIFAKPKSKLDHKLMLLACHLLTAACLVFISGIASPIAAVWLMYMLFSYIYFANKGLLISMASFIAAVLLDVFLWHDIGSHIATYDLITLSIIATGGLMLFGIINVKTPKAKHQKHHS